jgi:thiosulfate/3-mercaptopyruvate sulfurtransferase
MGITNTTTVVAYDDSRFAFAARLWWLLSYMGHDRVAVLDGGFAAWVAKGYAVTAEIPAAIPPETGFIPHVRSPMVIDMATVKAKKDLPTVALVDAREGDRYRGDREPIDLIAGHIPGAVNYPWLDVTDGQSYALPNQGDRWQALQHAEEIIVYCGSGVTACVNLLSLKLAGSDRGKLYAGSWSDWISYPDAAIGQIA